LVRIIYAVAGEGFGHSSRAHLIGQRLIDAGCDVIFAASQKSYVYLKQYFGERVKGGFSLSFAYHKGKVAPLRTIKKTFMDIPDAVRENKALFEKHFKPFDPDIVLTDFEPFTAWWAFVKKVPFISIDNEHILTVCKLEHRIRNFYPRLTAQAVTKSYYFGADAYIVFSFFNAPLKNEKAVLAPPIVRPIVTELKANNGDYILLYVTTSYGKEKLLEVLSRFSKKKFVIYGFNENAKIGNCILKDRSTEGFLQDLAGCGGIAASAGFSLISECLYFRKKMLLVPVEGQYEQIINAQYVEKLGLGIQAEKIDKRSMRRFLHSIDTPMPEDGGIIWPDNEKFFRILQQQFDKLPQNPGIKIC